MLCLSTTNAHFTLTSLPTFPAPPAPLLLLVGNARLRASAIEVTKEYEPWTPFEILNGDLVVEIEKPTFYRLRHLAIMDVQITVDTGSIAPDNIFVRLPSVVTPLLPDRAQQSPATCARHGLDIPSERWISPGTATVDPTQAGHFPHYIRIECDTGFLQNRVYDIFSQVVIELE